jgi:hypothetical protein
LITSKVLQQQRSVYTGGGGGGELFAANLEFGDKPSGNLDYGDLQLGPSFYPGGFWFVTIYEYK